MSFQYQWSKPYFGDIHILPTVVATFFPAAHHDVSTVFYETAILILSPLDSSLSDDMWYEGW